MVDFIGKEDELASVSLELLLYLAHELIEVAGEVVEHPETCFGSREIEVDIASVEFLFVVQ